jgi:Beta-propeller repeat
MRIALKGAASSPRIEGIDRMPGKSNYFIGNDPKKWHTNVPLYAKVELKNVYPGIDLIYHGSEQARLEYDFRVKPGADPDAIRLSFKGERKLALDRDGNLVVSVGESKLIEHAPVIYQDDAGKRKTIVGGWVIRGAHEAGFRLARYDRRRPLVIDPTLVYPTYLGGSGGDGANGIAVDSAGNAYVTGYTYSTNFPTTSGAFQTVNNAAASGGYNAFVTKLSAAGSALVYSTYLGGSGTNCGTGIAVDSSGEAYVGGYTASNDFPTKNPFQSSLAGTQNAFVTKLSPDESALIYSTYLAGCGKTGDEQRSMLS